MILVQDTKRPNREPFEVSEEGWRGLQNLGSRYQQVPKVIVTPTEVKVTKREIVTPAKTKSGQ